MSKLYRWTLVEIEAMPSGADGPIVTTLAEVTGDSWVVGASIKAIGNELFNRLNATLAAAGFAPVPAEPTTNGTARRPGRPRGSRNRAEPPTPVESEPPATAPPAIEPPATAVDPFARVHANSPETGPPPF